MQEKVLIVDFGSQYTQLIARRVRELFIFCEIYPFNSIPKNLKEYKAVILSGSPFSVRSENYLKIDLSKIKGKIPLLGVCYGAQFLAHFYGGEVTSSNKREYGRANLVDINFRDPFFNDISNKSQVWMSHSDTIKILPSNGTLKQGDTEINAAETTLTGTDITYTPNSNYSGNDSFTFKIKDKGVNSDGVTDVETSNAANISVTVNNTDNDPPVAENKSISAGQDTETSAITLVAADPDSDNSTLVYSIASLPSNGTLKDGGTEITGAADLTGALTYLPNNGYAGSDSFTFTAKDDQSADSAAATVSISV